MLGFTTGVRAQLSERLLMNPVFGDTSHFGASVAIDGDFAFVGAPDFRRHGAVFVFHRNIGGVNGWGHAHTLYPNDTIFTAGFGTSIDADGGVLVVGSTQEYDGFASNGLSGTYFFRWDPQLSSFVRDTLLLDPGESAWGSGVSVRRHGSSTVVADALLYIYDFNLPFIYHSGYHWFRDDTVPGTYVLAHSWENIGNIGSFSSPPFPMCLHNDTVIYRWVNDYWSAHTLQQQDFTIGNADNELPDYQAVDADDGTFALGRPLDDDQGQDAGSVLLFQVSDTMELITELYEPSPSAFSRFGSQVACRSGVLAVNDQERSLIYRRDLGGPDAWGLAQIVEPPQYELGGDIDISALGEVIVGGTFNGVGAMAYVLYDPTVTVPEPLAPSTIQCAYDPAHDRVVVRSSEPLVGQLELLDAQSRLLKRSTLHATIAVELDVSHLPPGLCVLRIIDPQYPVRNVSCKVLIQ
ncbi:MAG: hypothetical protein IPK99_11695 [Flavobacteriales bacterium]|nr:hypothetical protein [Flavobacteriales bacterium]